ncbi:uncharacterized protein V1510DRAFT_423674 [Dipodascopsis tothii]|uniref:uncharacterized protein n=1 Tax=Dipodascopsis tothii TaxID=44089 RepID=UPI0034CEACC1
MLKIPNIPYTAGPCPELLASAGTALPPRVMAFCPLDAQYLVAGTDRVEASGAREGTLDLFRHDGRSQKLERVSSTATGAAVLDIKFMGSMPWIFASAHSDGRVCFWYVNTDMFPLRNPELMLLSTTAVGEGDALVTSLCFSPHNDDVMSVTLSTGELKILDVPTGAVMLTKALPVFRECRPHKSAAYTSAFDSSRRGLVYTGGEDSSVRAYDIRMPKFAWRNPRAHPAGVTALMPLWGESTSATLWTGSYDGTVRVWDTSYAGYAMACGAAFEQGIEMGGGVWKFVPHEASGRVLACCMKGGARILAVDEITYWPEVEQSITSDGNLVYGGDWAPDGSVVGTCSFDDCQIKLWAADAPVYAR